MHAKIEYEKMVGVTQQQNWLMVHEELGSECRIPAASVSLASMMHNKIRQWA